MEFFLSGKKYHFRHHKLYSHLKTSLLMLKAQGKGQRGVAEMERRFQRAELGLSVLHLQRTS